MTNRAMTVLALRLFALYLLVYFLLSLPDLGSRLADRPAVAVLGAQSLPLLLALLFWHGVGPLADRILPRRSAGAELRAPTLPDVQAAAFAAVGLLLLGLALPRLLPALAAGAGAWLETGVWAAPADGVAAAEALLQLLLGVGLLLGGRGLSGAVLSLRRAGVYP